MGQIWGILQPLLLLFVEQLRKAGQWLWDKWWNLVLPQVQRRLPAPWSTRLSKPVLTGIAVSVLALLLWLPNTFSAKAPSSAEAPIDSIETPVAQTQPAPPAATIDPEQRAKIQERLAQVTEPYGEALIQRVQLSPNQSRLTVQIADAWYQLSPDIQDQLSSALLKRSQQLKFPTLEIQDSEGTLLARSPVVGSKVIVFQRQFPTESSPA